MGNVLVVTGNAMPGLWLQQCGHFDLFPINGRIDVLPIMGMGPVVCNMEVNHI